MYTTCECRPLLRMTPPHLFDLSKPVSLSTLGIVDRFYKKTDTWNLPRMKPGSRDEWRESEENPDELKIGSEIAEKSESHK